MPFVKRESVSENQEVGIWQITETEATLMEFLGSDLETTRYLSLKKTYKRLQHLAGRCALKWILSEKAGFHWKGFANITDLPKPEIIGFSGGVSVSHSGKYVAVCVGDKPKQGIDLELPKPKIQVISGRFLSETELSFFGNDLELITICWVIKEAVFKWAGLIGLSLRENILIFPFDFDRHSAEIKVMVNKDLITVKVFKFEGFWVAVVIRIWN